MSDAVSLFHCRRRFVKAIEHVSAETVRLLYANGLESWAGRFEVCDA